MDAEPTLAEQLETIIADAQMFLDELKADPTLEQDSRWRDHLECLAYDFTDL